MLAPGERVDATLDILDPGKDAEGFEIDVCLRSVEQKISVPDAAAPAMLRAPRPQTQTMSRQDRTVRVAVQRRACADGGRD